MEAVLEWLSPLNMYQKQQDVFSRRQTSTGSWLLRDPVFQAWENSESSHRTLWCPGDRIYCLIYMEIQLLTDYQAGTGKTVMT